MPDPLVDDDVAEQRAHAVIAERDVRRDVRGKLASEHVLFARLERRLGPRTAYTLQRPGQGDYSVRTLTHVGFGETRAEALQDLLDELGPERAPRRRRG